MPEYAGCSLSGNVCLVTGSSRGLGRAAAYALGRAGAAVVINGRNRERVASAVKELRNQGIEAEGKPFDVTDREASARSIDEIEDLIGPIDVLVNNAGVTVRASAVDLEDAQWDRVMDVNLKAVFTMSQIAGRRMIKRKRGKIIIIASLMSEKARPSILPYTVSKGGIRMMIRGLAAEWAGHNIQVNGIGPGYIETELTEPLRSDPEFDAWVRQRTPAGRWGKPEDIGGAAVFLASDMSDFINGQIIYVDGGWLAAV